MMDEGEREVSPEGKIRAIIRGGYIHLGGDMRQMCDVHKGSTYLGQYYINLGTPRAPAVAPHSISDVLISLS